MTPTSVYDNTLDDGKFRLLVERTEPYKGRLTVTVAKTAEVLHTEDVVLAYDAHFGADVEDVGEWERLTVRIVDDWLGRQ